MTDEDRLRVWLDSCDSIARISTTDWARLKKVLRQVRADERAKKTSQLPGEEQSK